MSDRMDGGCACGRIPFWARIENDEAYLCHSRMCRRATASISIAFKNVQKAGVSWARESDSENLDPVIAAFDDATRFRPAHHLGAEILRRSWLDPEGVPEYATKDCRPLIDRLVKATGKAPD